jgi:beta-phosphoglucomutase-like phosphatase (HAD superfamily)
MAHTAGPIFFDVDGVLVDSLPAHLELCRRLAVRLDISVRVPSERAFRLMAAAGTRISPMYYFFTSVGFPDHLARLAVHEYEANFKIEFQPKMFPGVSYLLREIHLSGRKLGIVSSNTFDNIANSLDGCMELFDPSCIFTKDRVRGRTKADCLSEGARLLDCPQDQCTYVGDLPSDAEAAAEVGFCFIGVTYGWGIISEASKYMVVSSVAELRFRLKGASSTLFEEANV